MTALGLLTVLAASCSTTYDSYGNARQTVDPAGVAVGAVALGVLAYSVGRSSGKRSERRRHQPVYHPAPPVYGPGCGRRVHCR